MATSTESQTWNMNKKQVDKKAFESPELLRNTAYKYFKWCDQHSWFKHEPVKSGVECGRIIDIPVKRPYSLSGLCVYLGCSRRFLRHFKKECSAEFKEVIAHIEDIIDTQQFEGSVTGIFSVSALSKKSIIADDRDEDDRTQTTELVIEVLDNKTKKNLEDLKDRLTLE